MCKLATILLCGVFAFAFVPYAFAGGSGSAQSDLLLINDTYMYAQIETDPAILRGDVQNVKLVITIMNADANPPVPVQGVQYTLVLADGHNTTLLEIDAFSPDASSVINVIPDASAIPPDVSGTLFADDVWLAAASDTSVDASVDPTTANSAPNVRAPVFLAGGLIYAHLDIHSINGVPLAADVTSGDLQFEIMFSVGEFIPFKVEIGDESTDLVFATYFDKINDFVYDDKKKTLSAIMPFDWDLQLVDDSIPFLHAEYYIPRSVELFEDHEIILSVNGIPYFGTVDRSGDDDIVVHFLISLSKLREMLKQIPSDERDHIIFEITSGKKYQKQKDGASLDAGDAIVVLSSQEDWKFHVYLEPSGMIYTDQTILLNIEFWDPVTNNVIPLITYDVDILLDGQYVLSESGRQTPDGKDKIPVEFTKTGSAIVQISNVNNYDTSGEFAFQVRERDYNSTSGSMNVFEPPYDYSIAMAQGSFLVGCERDNSCFEPADFVISKGKTISWINLDEQGHTVASGTPQDGSDGMFASPVVGSEMRYEYKFDTVGSFDYFCTLHPWMVGVITVNDYQNNSKVSTAPKHGSGDDGENKVVIPDWITTTAQWWSDGLVDDIEFANALEFLIKAKIVILSHHTDGLDDSDKRDYDNDDNGDNNSIKTNIEYENNNGDNIRPDTSDSTHDQNIVLIPDWIKTTAQWWSDGLVDDDEFVRAIEWMISNNIIRI